MRLSRSCFATFREFPSDAEVPSHQWLARAGMIVKHSAGIYSYSPLFFRALRKVATIIETEMDRAGAQQMLMPILQPAELWEKSGRWAVYDKAGIMFQVTDRKGGRHGLAPTAEEVVTDFVSRLIKSYKQLPITVYQQQDKFRDEFRPRFGIMRGREFMMKDAYSFDADDAGLAKSYQAMHDAYCRIFTRCGLEYIIVQADSGAIGGSGSEEFMVLAANGEDTLLYSDGYAANAEKATSAIDAPPDEPEQPCHKESTPNIRSVEELSAFFSMGAARMVKTILYRVTRQDEEFVAAVLMRGDQDINEVKLQNHFDALAVELADEVTVRRVTGAELGFAGPVGLAGEVRVLADLSVRGMKNFLCGACETDFHLLDVNDGRDFPTPAFADVRLARAGQQSVTGKPLQACKGIEVGHIFKLGAKYSKAMKAEFLDRDGKLQPFVMGCYGIGTSRVVAAAIEQHHDERGMCWPAAIAPYAVHLVAVNYKKDEVRAHADALYRQLQEAGVECLLDDRDVGAGVKFADADILGMPFRVTLGKGLKDGLVEFSTRKSGETLDVALAEAAGFVVARVRSALADGKQGKGDRPSEGDGCGVRIAQ